MNQMYTFIKPNLQENLKITCDLFRSGVVEEYDEKTALLDDILELKELVLCFLAFSMINFSTCLF